VHQVFTTKLENALKKLGEKLDKATISLQSLISLKDKTERGKKTQHIASHFQYAMNFDSPHNSTLSCMT
jgi:hypothetical protein